jgi:hypothetical protein
VNVCFVNESIHALTVDSDPPVGASTLWLAIERVFPLREIAVRERPMVGCLLCQYTLTVDSDPPVGASTLWLAIERAFHCER